ncbi:MAG: DNA-processing protein DprA [Thermodesulfovibrionales bacterium]
MSNLDSWIALSMVAEIGHVTYRKLLSIYGSPEAVFDAPLKELSGIDGVGERKARNIKDFSGWDDVRRQLAELNQMGVNVVSYNSPEYPQMLRQIENAPIILYVKGTIMDEDRFAIAIVGSRKPTTYGRLIAERLSSELSGSGFTIVSGMARGIDTIAHISSIRSGGRTIAVLGSGMDMPYPPENRGLMERITTSGYVITEFPLGTRPVKENFPVRNRLISGLSLGVLVVEAAGDSGSLITANYALEQNREVFAVPGNINSLNSAGTNELIKRGAKLIQKPDDIIEELAPVLKGFVRTMRTGRGDHALEMTDEEKRLCDILSGEPKHIDIISRELSMPPSKSLTLLLNLELKGVVRQTEGKRFYLAQ